MFQTIKSERAHEKTKNKHCHKLQTPTSSWEKMAQVLVAEMRTQQSEKTKTQILHLNSNQIFFIYNQVSTVKIREKFSVGRDNFVRRIPYTGSKKKE
jgi:hypothetical protein